MAPEVVRNEGHGAAADYWSLGAVLFECLHGCTPFAVHRDESTPKIYASILRYAKRRVQGGAAASAPWPPAGCGGAVQAARGCPAAARLDEGPLSLSFPILVYTDKSDRYNTCQ
jgi:serine/threonine protein kinase